MQPLARPVPVGARNDRHPDRGGRCGYLHAIAQGGGPDLCERCGAALDQPLTELLRLQNVATRRRDRISSDEEERQRQGYEVRTAVQFTEYDGHVARRTGDVEGSDGSIAAIDYGHAATIWRVNFGWSRRANRERLGFVLDTERGYWERNDQAVAEDPKDPMSGAARRVIPFVEDRRNCLLLEPNEPLSLGQMASLQAALKRGIQAVFQLEEQELAAEPLPTSDVRRLLMFFEAAEGGAGVLRRLLDDPAKLAEVAREALSICHFEPDTGADLHHAPGASEPCEAACYDCLLSYGNQRDHKLLDRQAIRDLLRELAGATVTAAAGSASPDEHLALLRERCDSDLERRFLDLLAEQRRRLPSDSQKLIASAQAKPDFLYGEQQVAVFIDVGPIHDQPDVQADDADATTRLEDIGYEVVRFHHAADWQTILDQYPSVFGANGGSA